ncbi:hypothetical protein [Paenibacillus apiarius]|uniref:hypothetical protein n=1 Tax=Paenibacillus apiarius TaxID=46240 RepID=UPI003B3A2040
MRTFEMLVIIVNVLLLGWLMFSRNKSLRGLLIGFTISTVLMLTHGWIEGMRWPMIPVYLMTLFPVVNVALWHIFKPKGENQNAPRRIRIILITTLAASYIIIGIDHTYSSVASIFPDERVANFDSGGAQGFE